MNSHSQNADILFATVVVSVFNEEEVLPGFYDELSRVLGQLGAAAEVIFVNDGSNDGSAAVLKELASLDPRVKIINLSRNYGHEAAMIAGIDHSRGNPVICMDADLQHPPAKIGEMLEQYRNGFEIVCMKRVASNNLSRFDKMKSLFFYRLLNQLSPMEFETGASDFFMVSRRVANILKVEFRERIRFLRGYVQTLGFRKSVISYTASERACGKSKYTFSDLCGLSLNAFFSFSNLPLRLGIITGLIVGGFSILVGIYSIVMRFIGNAPSGYTTIVVLVSFLFAIQFFITGIIGEYIGVILIQSRERPIYLVDSMMNIAECHEAE
ncbi:MAG: hypothetical protein ACD_55C00139G0003 [uncultured bacterium]|uniref:GDP-mannose--undecaprenyl-phosphate mannosyltransferase, putative n=1 Tax=Citrifermentans bemidjiense (strain ATCC BAA-1014 / DSM 16622 / JCM 12645 / Bem) TaxID=404380 RepID=B5E8N9_CITBB|nr:glycosyltransferase family 2 protein [Citrifermentans bemidjiense]ACH38624.1 GDP-mannose--undecaprenyl-phosphate mannosyltransferase, putative [Citrifermentans bemidjiense Bem]EKD59150.1 MAG: hypothetical protein ACD_55C00139G0003 [uncultured bacterium]